MGKVPVVMLAEAAFNVRKDLSFNSSQLPCAWASRRCSRWLISLHIMFAFDAMGLIQIRVKVALTNGLYMILSKENRFNGQQVRGKACKYRSKVR